MAVIISDMEHIPNGCFDCDLHNYHFCNLTGNLVENNLDDGTRADDCPLKEVPKCKDCKYFEYDHMENVSGIPLIVAHEICTRWGDGCKSNENGYCFLFEQKMVEE